MSRWDTRRWHGYQAGVQNRHHHRQNWQAIPGHLEESQALLNAGIVIVGPGDGSIGSTRFGMCGDGGGAHSRAWLWQPPRFSSFESSPDPTESRQVFYGCD